MPTNLVAMKLAKEKSTNDSKKLFLCNITKFDFKKCFGIISETIKKIIKGNSQLFLLRKHKESDSGGVKI